MKNRRSFLDWATENTWEKNLGNRLKPLQHLLDLGLSSSTIPHEDYRLENLLEYSAALRQLEKHKPARLVNTLFGYLTKPFSDGSRSSIGELFSAALASNFLASVEAVDVSKTPTPDLRGYTHEGKTVEFEVRTAKKKQLCFHNRPISTSCFLTSSCKAGSGNVLSTV